MTLPALERSREMHQHARKCVVRGRTKCLLIEYEIYPCSCNGHPPGCRRRTGVSGSRSGNVSCGPNLITASCGLQKGWSLEAPLTMAPD